MYNIVGSRCSHCSTLEAIALCEELAGRPLHRTYTETNRSGDPIWHISDIRKFQAHYPAWRQQYNLRQLLEDMLAKNAERWQRAGAWRRSLSRSANP